VRYEETLSTKKVENEKEDHNDFWKDEKFWLGKLLEYP
jgi:hypothetical protein